MKLLITLAPALATVASLQDREYKACWDINLQDENMFCYGAVNWSIDEENYYNSVKQDELAKSLYRALLFKWEMNTNKVQKDPTNDCLAVARQIYCTHAFPKCIDKNTQRAGMCTFMCELFEERCPVEYAEDIREGNEFSNLICTNSSSEVRTCSGAYTAIGKGL